MTNKYMFIAQVIEDYGWPEQEAIQIADYYEVAYVDRSWQERWEEFCDVENGAA